MRWWLLALGMAGAVLPVCGAVAATGQHPAPAAPVRAILVSDIHFEPFWDPGKAAQLAAAPESKWAAILASPDTAGRAEGFEKLQESCHARGSDTGYPLLAASMTAIRGHAEGAAFVLMSGDLVAHSVDCKFRTVFPHAGAYKYRSFVEKTIRFVMAQLESAAPGVPVYAALGNNDSDCGDYRMDAHSAFLESTAHAIAESLPRGERAGALASFSAIGSYSVLLPKPMRRTRLIVLDDVFLSAKHATCSGKPGDGDQRELLAWLKKQLDEARAAKERVWVMGHIPPGIDAYSTLAHIRGACKHPATLLLSTPRLANMLASASDVVTLGVFGHTHEDEFSLLSGESNAGPGEAGGTIPVKIVPSISPINGNEPSFLVAEIDPATATLVDYQDVAEGADKRWGETYDFTKTYGVKSFSGDTVGGLVQGFAADRSGDSAGSRAYIHNFLTGTHLPLLSLVWPDYVCTMEHHSAKGFAACACGGK